MSRAAVSSPAVRVSSAPGRLPGGPLVDAVHSHLAPRQVTLEALFARHPVLLRAYQNARGGGDVAAATAGRICSQLLLVDPVAVYGEAYLAATRASVRSQPPDGAVQLAVYQQVWDRMDAAATSGQWAGDLQDLLDDLALDQPARQLIRGLLAYGWVRVEHARAGGRVRGYRLVRRPNAAPVACAGPRCAEPIEIVAPDGTLRCPRPLYCSPRCRRAAATAHTVRRLDRLRGLAGLPPSGRDRLSDAEVDRLVHLLGRLPQARPPELPPTPERR